MLFAMSPVTVLLLAFLVGGNVAEQVHDKNRQISSKDNGDCPCGSDWIVNGRPPVQKKLETARWMVHALDWGVVSTLTTRITENDSSSSGARTPRPRPFGNVYSFVDGTCDNSTGVPYFYSTFLDQTMQDSLQSSAMSLTLSEAAVATTTCTSSSTAGRLKMCHMTGFGDPENPLCARLTLSGDIALVDPDSHEFLWAKDALFERHHSMAYWPDDHDWVIFKLDIKDIWLIDFFGGASILDVEDYLKMDMMTELGESNE